MNDIADNFWLSSDSAELYEKYLIPGWFNALTAITMHYAGDLKDKVLLDIATGTGIVPRFASKKIGEKGKIVGIDINKGMLAVAVRLKYLVLSFYTEMRQSFSLTTDRST